MIYAIKVAKAGFDVLDDPDINDLIFDSTVNTFKILAEGTLNSQSITTDPTTLTVAHGQTATPTVFALAEFPDGYLALPAETDHTFTVGGVRYWLVNVDATNISFIFYKGGTVSSDTGFFNASTAASDSSNGGTISWANFNDALSSNNAHATATFTVAATSHYLKITNFGFSIPTGATITGIELVKEGHFTKTDTLAGSSRARLVKAGSVVGTTYTTNFPETTDAEITEGGSSDLWGETWTPAQINASDFGVVLWTEITSVNGTGVIKVDAVTLKIYYTQNGGNYSVSVKYYIFETPAT